LPLDETLLPHLWAEISRRGGARFIGLHTIGSHWEYDTRYPPSFERFGSGKGLSYLSALNEKSDPRVLDSYDNSVAYTDWFLGQLIEQARQLNVPTTVTYIAITARTCTHWTATPGTVLRPTPSTNSTSRRLSG